MMELARQYGCHRTTVTKKLVDAGVEIREKTPTEKQMEEMVRLYTSGLSLARVGEQVGFSPNTVLRYLRERGTEIRRGPGRRATAGDWPCGLRLWICGFGRRRLALREQLVVVPREAGPVRQNFL